MLDSRISAVKLHRQYIMLTRKKSIVTNVTILLSYMTKKVVEEMGFSASKIYLSTRVLKHLYDKRPAEEYDFLIRNMQNIVKYPDTIYENRSGKRGDYTFMKVLAGEKYICTLETVEDMDNNEPNFYLVTCFRCNDKYLEKYKSLWNWKDDTPSS